jgi:2-oxoglutarate ferredoxin oxidoreductase subunit beta
MLEEQGHDPTDLHKAIDRGYQWGEEIPIGLFWRRTDLPTLEEQEPVLHTGEGPLGCRSNIGIVADQAKELVNELL